MNAFVVYIDEIYRFIMVYSNRLDTYSLSDI